MGGWGVGVGFNSLRNPASGAVGYTSTNPGLNTDRTPNTGRPTLVQAEVTIDCDKNESGQIRPMLNAGATEIGGSKVTFNDADAVNAKNVLVQATITFIVAAGMTYQLKSTVLVGAPAFTLDRCLELTL